MSAAAHPSNHPDFWPAGPKPLATVLRGLREMGGRLLSAAPAAIGAEQQWWLLESRLILVIVYDQAGESFEVFTSCGRDDVGEIKQSLEAWFARDASHAPKPERPAVIVPEKPKSRGARKPPLFADASST